MTGTSSHKTQNRRSAADSAGGQGRGRTADLTIFSRALYQLSYLTGHATGRTTWAGRVAELTGFEPATFTLTG